MITLYSTNCPQCNVLEKKLDSAHIQYVVDENIEHMKERGFMSAPMLDVDGKVLNFSEAIRWVKTYAN